MGPTKRFRRWRSRCLGRSRSGGSWTTTVSRSTWITSSLRTTSRMPNSPSCYRWLMLGSSKGRTVLLEATVGCFTQLVFKTQGRCVATSRSCPDVPDESACAFYLLAGLRKGMWAADGGAFAHLEDPMSKQRANDERYPPDSREHRAAKVGDTVNGTRNHR